MQGARVPSLVGELRSHMPPGAAQKAGPSWGRQKDTLCALTGVTYCEGPREEGKVQEGPGGDAQGVSWVPSK